MWMGYIYAYVQYYNIIITNVIYVCVTSVDSPGEVKCNNSL